MTVTVAPVGTGEGDGPIVADGEATREAGADEFLGAVVVRLAVAVMIAMAASPAAAAVRQTNMTVLRRLLPLMSLSG